MDWNVFREVYVYLRDAFRKFLEWLVVNFGGNDE